MPTAPTRRVMMLAFADCQILDVTGPLEILASAHEIDPAAPPPFMCHFCRTCREGASQSLVRLCVA